MIGETLSHYRITAKLGEGGMGQVYRAEDSKLEREVALKVLPEEFARDPERLARFEREAKTLAALNHPNIVTIYSVEQDDGRHFLTTELVEGESLAERIPENGFSLEDFLEIAVPLSDAVAAAHEKGVTHRDLKPANVMVTRRGQTKVLDFGLAKREGGALTGSGDPELTEATAMQLTQKGQILGTVVYMSPEQAEGKVLDARSDIFSLGVLLYEMATGERPFSGDSSVSILSSILKDKPASVSERKPNLPTHLGRIIGRCLEKDPDRRYQTAKDVRNELAGLQDESVVSVVEVPKQAALPWLPWALAGALALVVAVGFWTVRRWRTEVAAEAPTVVAVAPLRNLTGDSSLDWYSDGIASLVRDNLAQSRHLDVVSAARFAALSQSADDGAALLRLAGEAGIGYLTSGEILAGPDGLAVTARLVESVNGSEVAARSLGPLTSEGLIGVADQISSLVRLGLKVPRTEQVDFYAADFAVEHLAAYESYVNGLGYMLDFKYDQAETAFTAALELAPEFSMARYRLAHLQGASGDTQTALENFERVAQDPKLKDRESRYVRAGEALYSGRFDEAIDAYTQIMELYPFEIEAPMLRAEALRATRRYEEALELLVPLSREVPEDESVWSRLGWTYLALERPEEAATAFQRLVELSPESANAHHLLADARRFAGDDEGAAEEYRRALEFDPEFHFSAVELAELAVLDGRRDDAAEILAEVAFDEEGLLRTRVDAALKLAHVRRSEGRFREAAAVLEQLEKPIAETVVLEASALSVRGTSLMELGEVEKARTLLEEAVEKSPAGGVPTRYLFFRGLLEARQGESAAVRATAAEILESALPPENPDRTEDKAASYLTGLALLEEGRSSEALDSLGRAVELEGYEYVIYRLALGRGLLAAGRLPEALAEAEKATEPPPSHKPRLDLELDRVRGRLLRAEIHQAAGRREAARAEARRFLDAWAGADPGLAEVSAAERLVSPQAEVSAAPADRAISAGR